jgi:hypothetical protein
MDQTKPARSDGTALLEKACDVLEAVGASCRGHQSGGVGGQARAAAHHAVSHPVRFGGARAVAAGPVAAGVWHRLSAAPRGDRGAGGLCEAHDPLEQYLALRIKAGEALWRVYLPTDQAWADFAAWKAAGSRHEDAPVIRAEGCGVIAMDHREGAAVRGRQAGSGDRMDALEG